MDVVGENDADQSLYNFLLQIIPLLNNHSALHLFDQRIKPPDDFHQGMLIPALGGFHQFTKMASSFFHFDSLRL